MEEILALKSQPTTSTFDFMNMSRNKINENVRAKTISDEVSKYQRHLVIDSSSKIVYFARSYDQKFFTIGKQDGFEVIINSSTSVDNEDFEKNDCGYKCSPRCQKLDSTHLNRICFKTKGQVSLVKATSDLKTFAIVMEKEPNSVLLWSKEDQLGMKHIEFDSKIVEILFNSELLIVMLHTKTYVFKFPSLLCIDQIDTCYNAKGLGAVSTDDKPKNKLMILPHINIGEIILHFYCMGEVVEHTIAAHVTNLSALAANSSGTLIASASKRGTIIRIFSADGGNCLQELRRGIGEATINDLVFHPSMNILACGSNHGKVHLFEIKESVDKCVKSNDYGFDKNVLKNNVSSFSNRKSKFKFLKFLSDYFSSEWSVTKIKLAKGRKVLCFDPSEQTPDRLICMNKDDLAKNISFYKFKFSIKNNFY